MQFPARFTNLPDYAFARLRALLDPHPPGAEPVALSIGDPTHPPPQVALEALAAHAHLWGRYPPNEGAPGLRGAIADWLARRYGLAANRADPDRCVLPLSGTREGLFMACVALGAESKAGARPAVLIPNPFYQCYAAAALAAGAEPVYVDDDPATGLPDFAGLPPDLLDRATVAYVCSPSNPAGAVASIAWWTEAIRLAERHDFRLFADECYAEIWRDEAPPGALAAAQAIDADPERVLAFHSLSKRSNLAGLRSGFCAGGPQTIAAVSRLRAYGGAPSPLPAQAAAEAAWRDEAHVVANRALYAEKYALADEILGGLNGYQSPRAGFFLWLSVQDGEAAALRLWREAGVRTLPGAYLSRPTRRGGALRDPGRQRLRVALVAPPPTLRRGLEAIRSILAEDPPADGEARA